MTTPPSNDKGHVLGLGISPTFNNLVTGEIFNRANARALNNSNSIPVSADLAHVNTGFRVAGMSCRGGNKPFCFY